MPRPKSLPAFSKDQKALAHTLLATRVAFMMGRKMEEDDWAEVYCRAKGIEKRGWSNLDIDVAHDLLGVEHKMMKVSSQGDIIEACGSRKMHPAATRSIRVPPITTDANEAMMDVLGQYSSLIQARSRKIKEAASSSGEPDMRTGWLLWQQSLRQFMYFEEEMILPDPQDFYAEWVSRVTKGTRKPSTNLWIYEKETNQKRYSVTTEAGVKIQPYFDIPSTSDPNLYIFTVIGEEIRLGFVRVWITDATHRELVRLVGKTDPDALSQVILETVDSVDEMDLVEEASQEQAHSIEITVSAYNALKDTLQGVSDEHCFQLLLQHVRKGPRLSKRDE